MTGYREMFKMDREMMLRCHLYMFLLSKSIYPEGSELLVLLELYNRGGISGSADNLMFLDRCVELGIRRSRGSVRNVLSKYTNNGIIIKNGNCDRKLSSDIFPNNMGKDLLFQYLITNIDEDRSAQD